jgi:hypothetical protein
MQRFQLSGAEPGERMLRIVRKLLHPTAQLRRMNPGLSMPAHDTIRRPAILW